MFQWTLKVIVLVLFVVGIIYLKIQVISHEKELISIRKDITVIKEDMEMLEAEFTYLSRPERIRKIAGEKLNLQFPRGGQVTKLEIDLGQYGYR